LPPDHRRHPTPTVDTADPLAQVLQALAQRPESPRVRAWALALLERGESRGGAAVVREDRAKERA
jgi:hypothetical protein